MKKITPTKLKKSLKGRGIEIYKIAKSYRTKSFLKGRVLAKSKDDHELALMIINLLEGTQYFEELKEKSVKAKTIKQKESLFLKAFSSLSIMAPEGYILDYKGDGIGFFKETP